MHASQKHADMWNKTCSVPTAFCLAALPNILVQKQYQNCFKVYWSRQFLQAMLEVKKAKPNFTYVEDSAARTIRERHSWISPERPTVWQVRQVPAMMLSTMVDWTVLCLTLQETPYACCAQNLWLKVGLLVYLLWTCPRILQNAV